MHLQESSGLPGAEATHIGQQADGVGVLQAEVHVHPSIIDRRHQLYFQSTPEVVWVQRGLQGVHLESQYLVVLSIGQGSELGEGVLESPSQ